MRRLRLSLLCLAGLTLAALSGTARDSAPDWLAAAARQPVTVPTTDADAVVLWDEGLLTIARDGTFTRRLRWAVRVLQRDGRDEAVARAPFDSSTGKVRTLQAWLINRHGDVTSYGRRSVEEVARHGAYELYSGQRVQRIDAAVSAIQPGEVFGCETVIEERSLFADDSWSFQGTLPVQLSRFSVELPAGWQVRSHFFNHGPVPAEVQGAVHTWTLTALPEIVPEPMAPPPAALAPWLALAFEPPDGPARKLRRIGVSDWAALSREFTPAYDAAGTCDAAMAARARELTATAATPWERIHALARFAQQVNYISITLDARSGDGVFPRPSADVFRLNYGDCKDKATLLRALLQNAGIAAHPVIVKSGGYVWVDPAWPSAGQFNHAILAIAVPDDLQARAIITHPTLGRLLLFDPTDDLTPPGHLNTSALAGHGLLLAGADGGLIELPRTAPGDFGVTRRIAARLEADGRISGAVQEDTVGLSARTERGLHRGHTPTDYRELIRDWLAGTMPGVTTPRVEATDDFDGARFSLSADFAAPNYGKPMRNVLLVFKPVLIGRRDALALDRKSRAREVIIPWSSFAEETTIELPEGFRVDELPEPVDLQPAFGRYTAQAVVAGNQLTFTRRLELQRHDVPAGEIEGVRAFYEQMLRAEQTPVVLERL